MLAKYQGFWERFLLHCFGLIEADLVLGNWLEILWHVHMALCEVV